MSFVYQDFALGRRDFLDGRPLHCGTLVQARTSSSEAWQNGRYEVDRHGGYVVFPDDTTLKVEACELRRQS